MATDPIGLISRLNALSLMLITPEYYKIKRSRIKTANRIDQSPANFAMQLREIQVDGLTIRFARGGNSDGPTILFLSPLPQSILCYDAVWKALAPKAKLIAIDLPGFGGSEGGKDLMSFAAQSAFFAKIVAALDLSDFHVVAPDVAMPVALHYVLHRNHKANSLLIGDGPGILPSADGSLIRKIVGSRFWRMIVNMTGARTFIAGANTLGYLHYSPKAEEVSDYVASYSNRIAQVTKFFKGYPDGLKEIDPYIDSLNLPVHVFWGDHDAFLNADNARELHARLPNSELTIFEHCGHFSYQDKSTEFSTMISSWVRLNLDQIDQRSINTERA